MKTSKQRNCLSMVEPTLIPAQHVSLFKNILKFEKVPTTTAPYYLRVFPSIDSKKAYQNYSKYMRLSMPQ